MGEMTSDIQDLPTLLSQSDRTYILLFHHLMSPPSLKTEHKCFLSMSSLITIVSFLNRHHFLQLRVAKVEEESHYRLEWLGGTSEIRSH